MSKKGVVVYGPAGCGKTQNAERLREHLKLKHVVDEWRIGDPIEVDTLHLTNNQFSGGIHYSTVMQSSDLAQMDEIEVGICPICYRVVEAVKKRCPDCSVPLC